MSSKHLAFAWNPLWPKYVAFGAMAFSFVVGAYRFVLGLADPMHCNTLMNEGQYLDSNHRNWQPEGCMLHTYTPKDVGLCLSRQQVDFIGDSTTRQLFFALVQIADPELPAGPPNNEEKHANHTLTSHAGTRFTFTWDPYLNLSHTRDVISSRDRHSLTAPHGVGPRAPALLVLGSGLWYLRYSESSGGLPAWEKMIEDTLGKLARTWPKPANELVLLPVSEVVPSKLSEERFLSIHGSDIDAMNSDLSQRIRPLSNLPFPALHAAPSPPVALPLVFNQLLDETETGDGLHYSEKIRSSQANILLNMLCNDALPKSFPFDKTCCRQYPAPSFLQALVILTLLLLAPFVWFCSRRLSVTQNTSTIGQTESLIGAFGIVGLAVGLLFVADRTNFWLKEHKQFDPWNFGLLLFGGLAVGLATLKRADKDLGFLNRQQTDEWKGWMQIIILIYHYFGASKISGIYNPVRVLVASYLFMTGYGHTTFYIKKAQFGFQRIAQVMIRLNLFTLILAYSMNTDYVFYYFSPLVSYWFLIIYVTMATGSQLNDRVAFLIAKIFVSMGLITAFMKQQWLLRWLFDLLAWSFGLLWSDRESAFRINLDIWIVYAGMLTAIAVIKFRELRLLDHPKWPLVHKTAVGASALILVWYFAFELMQESKFTYNLWHPYISVLPIGAFIVLRNSTAILRSVHSRAFAFIGGCSLETFVIQYHFWLAADTKGVLLVLPGTRLRPLNIILTSVMFIFLSHRVAEASGVLTDWICGSAPAVLPIANAASSADDRVVEEAIPLSSRDHPVEIPGHKGHDTRDHTLPLAPHPPRRAGRWLDRLADGPPIEYEREVKWTPGVKTKIASMTLLMWALNILWQYP